MLKTLIFSRIAAFFSGGASRRRQKGKGRVGRTVLMTLLFVYVFVVLFAMMFGLFVSMMPALAAHNAQWMAFAVAAIAGCVVSLLFDIPMAQAQLYEARDNEMLLAMPIPPWMILFSRMLALYGVSLLFSLCFYLPALIVCAMYMPIGVLDVLCFLAAALVVQLLPLALSCLFARAFAYLKARFARAQIVSALLMGILMCVYFYFCANANELMQGLIVNAPAAAEQIRLYAYPFYAFGRACLGAGFELLTLTLICAAVFAPVYVYLSRSFTRLVISSKPQRVRGERSERERTPFAALTMRELRHFSSSSAYMMNAGLGLLMQLAAAVFLLVKKDAVLASAQGFFSAEALCAMAALAICLVGSTSVISAASVSLERNSIWIVQSLPVKASTVLFSKAFCHFVLCAPVSVVSSLLIAAAMPDAGAAGWLLLVLSPLVMAAFCALLGVCMNLVFPRLDFISDVAVIKRSGSVVCTMFLGWAVVGIPAALYGFVLSAYLSPYSALALYTLLLGAACLLMASYLKKKGARKFAYLS